MSRTEARIESSTVASLRVDHVTNTMYSDIQKSYIQGEQCRLLLDHFGERKVTHPFHLKVKLNCLGTVMDCYGIEYHVVIH